MSSGSLYNLPNVAKESLWTMPHGGASNQLITSTIHSNIHVQFEVSASALSVDATGSFGVLAGRKGLHLVDLESPYAPACTLHHQTKWEVGVVKCNPHFAFKGYVASTSSHNTLIWDIMKAPTYARRVTSIGVGAGSSDIISKSKHNQPLITTLRGHKRPVNDLSWSLSSPHLLATCSSDTKTHIWDVRCPQLPIQTYSTITAPTLQVKWNPVDFTTLATTNDGEVRVWDTRMGDKNNTPVVTITAHTQKIFGLDWHPREQYELLTCSEDNSVKFWNITQPHMPQGQIGSSERPVWRARYTPFGDAVVTTSPRSNDTALNLYALTHSDTSGISTTLVHSFTGHADVVKGFVWRELSSHRAYQLISWSKKHELRMWSIEAVLLSTCGYEAPFGDVGATAGIIPTNTVGSENPGNFVNNRDGSMHRQGSNEPSNSNNKPNGLSFKIDPSALKNDLEPLLVPPAATPLAADEYSLESISRWLEKNDTPKNETTSSNQHIQKLRTMLAFDEEEWKTPEDDVTSDFEESTRGKGKTAEMKTSDLDRKSSASSSSSSISLSLSIARALPCPRLCGACFSGPNMLVMFDSRSILGQQGVQRGGINLHNINSPGSTNESPNSWLRTRSSSNNQNSNATDESQSVASRELPRTYDELLEVLAEKFQAKKVPSTLSSLMKPLPTSSSSMSLNSNASISDFWLQSSDFLSQSLGFADDGQRNVASTGLNQQQMPLSSNSYLMRSRGASSAFGLRGKNSDLESSVHGGSEYRSMFHPSVTLRREHSVLSPTSGTPRQLLKNHHAPRSGGLLQHQFISFGGSGQELILSVTVLDLSKLCGISPILTFKTQFHAIEKRNQGKESIFREVLQEDMTIKKQFGSRSVLSWLYQAAQRLDTRHKNIVKVDPLHNRGNFYTENTQLPKNQLSQMLQTLLTHQANVSGKGNQHEAVAEACAHNANIASLAGRKDLRQIWSLLSLSTSSQVQLPLYMQNSAFNDVSTKPQLPTTHPWSAHPFGRGLVKKILNMYEQTKDLHTLASIVCVLDTSSDYASAQPQPFLPMEDNSGSKNSFAISSYISPKLTAAGNVRSPILLGTAGYQSDKSPIILGMNEEKFAQLQSSEQFRRYSDVESSGDDFNEVHGKITKSISVASQQRNIQSDSKGKTRHKIVSLLQGKGFSGSHGKQGNYASSSTKTDQTENIMTVSQPSWKAELKKLENSLKTWHASSVEAPLSGSRNLTSETFQPPNFLALQNSISVDITSSFGSQSGSSKKLVSIKQPESVALRPQPSPNFFFHSSILSPVVQAEDSGDYLPPFSISQPFTIEKMQVMSDVAINVHLHEASESDGKTLLSTELTDIQGYDQYKICYAEVLYQYGALTHRADVLKSLSSDGAKAKKTKDSLGFELICQVCHQTCKTRWCLSCNDFALKCSICQLTVRGQSMFCVACGHGGHEQHMREWFEIDKVCPTGCGCYCLQASSSSISDTDLDTIGLNGPLSPQAVDSLLMHDHL